MQNKLRNLCTVVAFSASAMVFAQPAHPVLDVEVVPSPGFNGPVDIANAGDDRLFIVEQDGYIRILNTDGTSSLFLDIDSKVKSTGGEQGLLGLAFDPNYAENGYFYVNYTNNTGTGNTVIARYSRNAINPNIADVGSEVILMNIVQPFTNHNGGNLEFGPDGYLYIGTGDGGSGGDPGNRAQDITDQLLGKMLRIDVSTVPYSIPASNPFVGITGDDEIWHVGLRNPCVFLSTVKPAICGLVMLVRVHGKKLIFNLQVQPVAKIGDGVVTKEMQLIIQQVVVLLALMISLYMLSTILSVQVVLPSQADMFTAVLNIPEW